MEGSPFIEVAMESFQYLPCSTQFVNRGERVSGRPHAFAKGESLADADLVATRPEN